MSNKSKNFAETLFSWHSRIHRDMPWKETKDPYRIWVSEIILQQTRVEQGRSYYINFIKKFPSISSLANSNVESVLKAWEGLGYYSRARNMHEAAKDIDVRFDGHFPSKYDDIKSLKGVGPYTAAAIASFAFGLPYAVLDGNVMRVLSRFFGYASPIDSVQGKKYLNQLAEKCLDQVSPDRYNQAIMDFGSLHCTPQNPSCTSCPFSLNCIANLKNCVSRIPLKEKKIKIRKRYLHYFIYSKNDQLLIQQRAEKGIWGKLHEFPHAETSTATDIDSLKNIIKGSNNRLRLTHLNNPDHQLSHQRLKISFYKINSIPDSVYFRFAQLKKVEELSTFAFPRPLNNFLKNANF